MYGYIYKLTDKKSNKIYIGAKTGSKIIPSYFGSGSKWNKEVISKCNPETDIDREILQKCDTVEELNQAEQYWINYFDSTNPDIGYNILKGGNLPTPEYKQRMSETIHNGMTDERKKKISNGMKKMLKEKGISDTHRQRISDALNDRNIGCNSDTRSIGVYCIIDKQLFEFYNKIQAAKWWYDNYPFSENYAEITYTRAITKSINDDKITYKSKPIPDKIKWFLSDSKEEPVYCIIENQRFDFKNKDYAANWWYYSWGYSMDYNHLGYVYKISNSINSNKPFSYFDGTKKVSIQWFKKGSD